MSKTDNVRPVSSIKHDDKRAAIPDSAHQGEEQMAISGQPEVDTMGSGESVTVTICPDLHVTRLESET